MNLPEKDAARFWSKVDKDAPNGCWQFSDRESSDYGRFMWGPYKAPSRMLAHRLAYELLVGPIPEDLCLDHLEPVTQRENILRGEAPTAKNARKTHCDWGHEFTPENTHQRKDGRECRECMKWIQHNSKVQQRLNRRYPDAIWKVGRISDADYAALAEVRSIPLPDGDTLMVLPFAEVEAALDHAAVCEHFGGVG